MKGWRIRPWLVWTRWYWPRSGDHFGNRATRFNGASLLPAYTDSVGWSLDNSECTNPYRHFHWRSGLIVEILYNSKRIKDLQCSSLHSIGMASEHFCGTGINDASLHTAPRHPQGCHETVRNVSEEDFIYKGDLAWKVISYPDGPAPIMTTSVVDCKDVVMILLQKVGINNPKRRKKINVVDRA